MTVGVGNDWGGEKVLISVNLILFLRGILVIETRKHELCSAQSDLSLESLEPAGK